MKTPHPLRPLLPLLLAAALAGCAGTPAAPPRYYQLRLEAPAPPPAQASALAEGHWQLLSPVRLPDYLERDVLWLPVGTAGLQPLSGHRWAEPLHEAVPRILGHDLALLHGSDRVWRGALPPGVVVRHQLRVELLEFGATADRRSVRLSARVAVLDPGGKARPRLLDLTVDAAAAGPDAEQLVTAHRLALWQLAQALSLKLAGS